MLISKLILNNFRNHGKLNLELPKLLYISGGNGAGKTTIIESLYLLLTSKTFRKQRLHHMVNFSEKFFRINILIDHYKYKEATFFYDTGKKFLINGGSDYSFTDFTFDLPVVCYSPSFDTILSDEHDDRRNFIDRMIFYIDKLHMQDVVQYNRLIKRKRAEILSDHPNIEIIKIITEQASELSDKISERRVNLITYINTSLQSNAEYHFIMPDMEIDISVNSLKDVNLIKEIDNQRVLSGCHKDLVYIKKDGKVVERFQSFGQKKSCLLLILYHMSIMIDKLRGEDGEGNDTKVLLLLDDFEAGLDNKRINVLWDLFITEESSKRQIVLTGLKSTKLSSDNSFNLVYP